MSRETSTPARKYRLVRLIKRGGTSELFEALVEGTGGFQRRVALKRLLPEHAGEEPMLGRFADEARLVSQLHHANIVSVFDYGVMDGLPFQVLELVDGLDLASLAERLARQRPGDRPARVSVAAALYVAAEVARALDYAHRARGAGGEPLGIVHRDVTPENVLISWAGDVKLADFGVAHAFERRAPTVAAVALGKAAYMAPEQLRGEVADARADLFALGCVLHALLAGVSPMSSEGARREVLAGGRLALDRGLDPDLAALIGRATATQRAARHPSAAAFAADAQRLLAQHAPGGGRDELCAILEPLAAQSKPTAPGPKHPLLDLMDVELVLADTVPPDAPHDAPPPARPRTRATGEPPAPGGAPEGRFATTVPERSGGLRRFVSVAADPVTEARAMTALAAGEYELLDELGAGGFAIVYRGRHRVTGELRAIKVLKAGAPPDHALRFKREAEVLSRLDHPNIVRVEETGVLADGRAYLVMELVEGRTLRQVIEEQGALSDARAMMLGRQIALGLGAVHRLGLIHRDLKPTNVLLATRPARSPSRSAQPEEVVKVVDFGVALLAAEGSEETRLTRAGRTVGTPRWMSPEQIRADADLGPRSDLYALGALLYMMVAGRPTFRGGTTDEVMDNHLYLPPPPLERPSALEPLIMSLLAKDPAARPEDAARVIAWLDRLSGGPGSGAAEVTELVGARRGSTEPATVLHDPGTILRDTAVVAPDPRITVLVDKGPPVRRGPVLALILVVAALAGLIAALLGSAGRVEESVLSGPVAIVRPGAVPRPKPAEPLEAPEPPGARSREPDPVAEEVRVPAEGEPAREKRRPSSGRGERRGAAPEVSPAPLPRLEQEVARLAEARALDPERLEEHDRTRALAAKLARARAAGDEPAMREVLVSLGAVLRDLPVDRGVVERKLDRLRRALSRAAPALDPQDLAAFERRYLDLRASLAEDPGTGRAAELAAKADALARELAAHPR